MLKKNCRVDFEKCEKFDELENAESELFVRLCGEIDHHSAVSVRTRIDRKIAEERPKRTVLDLSGIDFMDSSGLGLVMGRYARMQEQGGELVVLNPTERAMRIFVLSGLDKRITIIKEEVREKDGGKDEK